MRVDSITPILNVSDLRASLDWFEALGWKTGFVWGEPPGFASVVCGDPAGRGEIFLCLDGQGSSGTRLPERPFDERADGVWMSWFLPGREDFDAAYACSRARLRDIAGADGRAVGYPRIPPPPPGRPHLPGRLRTGPLGLRRLRLRNASVTVAATARTRHGSVTKAHAPASRPASRCQAL